MSYNIFPFNSAPIIFPLTKKGIVGTSTGATTIYTTSSSGRFVPLYINVEPTTVSGLVSVSTLSIGTNASSYDNILTASPLTGATSVNSTIQFSANALVSSVNTSTDIKVNITVAAVGTTYTLRVTLIGFYY